MGDQAVSGLREDVVDVLDENDIRSESGKIVQQRAIAAWMKHDTTGTVAAKLAVQVRRDRIGLM